MLIVDIANANSKWAINASSPLLAGNVHNAFVVFMNVEIIILQDNGNELKVIEYDAQDERLISKRNFPSLKSLHCTNASKAIFG